MQEAMAQGTRELVGMRLQCLCGQEQFYSGVDEHVYACTACHREYHLHQAGPAIVVSLRMGRAR